MNTCHVHLALSHNRRGVTTCIHTFRLPCTLTAGGLRTSHAQTYIALEAMGMRPIPKTPVPQEGADADGTVALGFPYQGSWEAIDPAQMPSPQMELGDSMRFTASQCVRHRTNLRNPPQCLCLIPCLSLSRSQGHAAGTFQRRKRLMVT